MKHLHIWEQIIKNIKGNIEHYDSQSIVFTFANNSSRYSVEKNENNNLILNKRDNDEISKTEEIIINNKLISDINTCRAPIIQNIIKTFG